MSLCGLQDSWGGGGGGTTAPSDVPLAIWNASLTPTPPDLPTTGFIPGTTAQPAPPTAVLSPQGEIVWDITGLIPSMGQTSVLNPPGPPSLEYSGTLSVQLAMSATPDGITYMGTQTTARFSIAVGGTLGSADYLQTYNAELIGKVIGSSGPASAAYFTLTAPIQFTGEVVPGALNLYFIWQNLAPVVAGAGVPTGVWFTVTPLSLQITPNAPITRVAGTIPSPSY